MGWTQETRLENHDGQSLPAASLFCDLQWICGQSELILRLKARWNAELRCSAPSRKEDAARLRGSGWLQYKEFGPATPAFDHGQESSSSSFMLK
ncbi:hypothetical protein SRHO_G00011160 [Serrasalmus rhombeus]